MSYVHATATHNIVFHDEKDYLKCRLLYLESFNEDASGDITFGFYIENSLYTEVADYQEGDIRVLDVQRSLVPSNNKWRVYSSPYSGESGPSNR